MIELHHPFLLFLHPPLQAHNSPLDLVNSRFHLFHGRFHELVVRVAFVVRVVFVSLSDVGEAACEDRVELGLGDAVLRVEMLGKMFDTKDFCHSGFIRNKFDKILAVNCLGHSIIADAIEPDRDVCLRNRFVMLHGVSQFLPFDFCGCRDFSGISWLLGCLLEVDSAAYGEKKC